MREALHREGYDRRVALHACLLVFCFESLQGHQAAASVHAAGAVSLLQTWNRERKLKGIKEFGDTAGDDASLSFAVACLDFQALAFMDSRSSEVHETTARELMAGVGSMPASLNSTGHFRILEDCQIHGHIIMRRSFHFVCIVRMYLAKDNQNNSVTDLDEKCATLRPGNNSWANGPLNNVQFPEEMLQEYDVHMEDIRRWQAAAMPALQLSLKEKDSEYYILATLVQIRCTMTVLTLAGSFLSDEAGYDDFIEDLREITSLVSSIWATATSSASCFTFQIGMLPALILVGMHCRHREIRKQAIDMMYREEGYREGIWDSSAIARISNYVRNHEEKWMNDDGHIPGEMRVILLVVIFRCRRRKLESSIHRRPHQVI